MSEAVLYSLEGETVTLTLNRPEQLNALGHDLVEGLHAGLSCAEADNVRHIIINAAGKGFSGGLDLSRLSEQSDADLLFQLVRIEQLLQRIRHSPCSTLALVHGACYGAAADLVLCCRDRIATTDARFLMPGLRFGVVLGTQRLRDVVGEASAYFLLNRHQPFTAAEAREHGFITGIASTAQWPEEITRVIKSVSGFAASAYANRVSSLTPDTRAEDMQALVSSVIGSTGNESIKARLQDYVAVMKARRS